VYSLCDLFSGLVLLQSVLGVPAAPAVLLMWQFALLT
jgi:hypothetical protein